METRVKKWAHYRKRIERSSFSGFRKRRKGNFQLPEEEDALKKAKLSKNAVNYASIGGKNYHGFTFQEFQTRKKIFFLLKFFVVFALVAALTILYFHWVKG